MFFCKYCKIFKNTFSYRNTYSSYFSEILYHDSDGNWTRTQNHLVLKRTLNYLAKLLACFEQGVPWHSGKYRVWIHSEKRTWHDKNMQSIRIRYFRPIFYYCKIRPCSKKNFTIDRSKEMVFPRLRFQFSFKNFFCYLIIWFVMS